MKSSDPMRMRVAIALLWAWPLLLGLGCTRGCQEVDPMVSPDGAEIDHADAPPLDMKGLYPVAEPGAARRAP